MELRIWAEIFEDIQKSRMANMNRALRGGVSPDVYDLVLESIVMTENEAKKGMEACLKRVAPEPILTWIEGIRGLGYPSMARLLGHLGHPRHATPHRWVSGKAPEEHVCPLDAEGKPAHCNKDRHLVELEPYERTVSQLWAYCGHGDPTRRRRAGATAEEMFACGNPTLKTIVWLISTNLIKAGRNPYREVYDEARIDYVDRVHAVPCVRCGPSGKPAQPGSPWSKGHQNAAAIRLVGKTVLRDLWVVAGR